MYIIKQDKINYKEMINVYKSEIICMEVDMDTVILFGWAHAGAIKGVSHFSTLEGGPEADSSYIF